jgi:hypothetical protein
MAQWVTESEATGRLAPPSGPTIEPRQDRLAVHDRRREIYRLLVADQPRYAPAPEE